jgi:hypothetical protein
VHDVIRDGDNGFRVAVGDIAGFAARLRHLHDQPTTCDRLARAAYQSVRDGIYNADAMVDAYINLFGRVRQAVREGTYLRPAGRVLPPPREVAGLSIFPVEHAGYVEQVEQTLADRPLLERLSQGLAAGWRAFARRLRPVPAQPEVVGAADETAW